MKIVFDLTTFDAETETDRLGDILRIFLTKNGGHPHSGRDVAGSGWSAVT